MNELPIQPDVMQIVLHKVDALEKELRIITGFSLKIRLEMLPIELTEKLLQTVIAKNFGVTWTEVKSRKRRSEMVFARHAYCYISRIILKKSFSAIGKNLGGLDHTSVIYGVRNAKNMIETDHTPFTTAYNKTCKTFCNEAETN